MSIYVPTAQGWFYVAIVIDLFCLCVVGRSTSDRMTIEMIENTLIMAIWHRGRTKELPLQSDQGSLWTRKPFPRPMAGYSPKILDKRSTKA